MHVSPAAPQCTVTPPRVHKNFLCTLAHHPLAGKWFVFARKKNEKAAWRETMASPGSPLSPLFPLFLFLSFSLSPSLSLSLPPLSLSLFVSFSLSVSQSLSLSLKGHTQKNCRVNAHLYGGPTDFASNCIHLGG